MPVEFLRIDDRLIHGQVVESWLPFLKTELVIVVSDSAAADDVQVALMKMAMPSSVDLVVCRVADANKILSSAGAAAKKTLLLVPGPKEALALVNAGVRIARVNVGGLHYTVGKIQLGRALFLDDGDKAALKGLADKGIQLEGRALPTDSEENLIGVLASR